MYLKKLKTKDSHFGMIMAVHQASISCKPYWAYLGKEAMQPLKVEALISGTIGPRNHYSSLGSHGVQIGVLRSTPSKRA